ncbi:hypothetical protein SISSUDRAFT_1050239 [Sistotremastrum suecicum HHB10207 ss-3]|uniref:Uncharacterized protein n=1 Tax=Sistotremastrum suecicum HHB10207 ss-3 TaxID=1314776 RepID=A0A166BC78_9AGAM|nr:hypothetical protein SISSUDRAFT_1050239 [Sistotremastrum suecicum HHB10207 ss-3]
MYTSINDYNDYKSRHRVGGEANDRVGAVPLSSWFNWPTLLYTPGRARGTMRKRASEVPEIDGSEGGFIGLVVALAVLIFLSCVCVYFLLRVRKGGGRGRGHVSHFKNMRGTDTYGDEAPDDNKEHGAFAALRWNFKRLIGRGRQTGTGWIQQRDMEGDIDSDDDDTHFLRPPRQSLGSSQNDQRETSRGIGLKHHRTNRNSKLPPLPPSETADEYPNIAPYGPYTPHHSDSVSSVGLEAPGTELEPPRPRSRSPLPDPINIPARYPTTAQKSVTSPLNDSPVTVTSVDSQRSGSKFREEL